MDDEQQEQPEKPTQNGRDGKGRFAKGNPGGPGCPYAAKVQAFRREMFAAVNPTDVKAVTLSVIDNAKQGSIKHQQLFFDVLGLRIKHVEVTDNTSILKTY